VGTWLRRCWNCGKAVGARDRFCLACGARQRDPER
jgi:rRNA maturation endonuclease Nob1